MASIKESVASWASILATLFTIIAFIQSEPWLATTSVTFLGVSLYTALVARRKRLALNSATITIEGRSIDSLNLANLRRRVNRSLVIQEVNRVATIRGPDLNIESDYAGFCRAKREAAFEFSIDADNHVPFHHLQCVGYDLLRDPGRKNPIRPLLRGADGNSKKIAVPFLAPLRERQPFRMLLHCTMPDCMKAGIDYYAAALSFDQDTDPRSVVRLVFVGDMPQWIRVYEANGQRAPRLLKDLPVCFETPQYREYVDEAGNVAGQSVRIYVFNRPAIGQDFAAPLAPAA